MAPDITDRVIEELDKLGNTHREVGMKLGIRPETVLFWREGMAVPKTHSLAKFHAAGLDIFYIITGKRIGDIVTKSCCNCAHFDECDAYDCDSECDSCGHNACRNCANASNWLWEGYTHAEK